MPMTWIVRHRRSLLLLLLLPVLAGAGAAFVLPVSLFPNVVFPRVRMTLDAGSRPAQQMELQVTVPVELAVHGLLHVVDVRSKTSRGSAEVSISFDWGTDMIAAALQVNAAVAQIAGQLPPGTKVTTERMDPTVFAIIGYSLTSTTIPLSQLLRYRDLPIAAAAHRHNRSVARQRDRRQRSGISCDRRSQAPDRQRTYHR